MPRRFRRSKTKCTAKSCRLVSPRREEELLLEEMKKIEKKPKNEKKPQDNNIEKHFENLRSNYERSLKEYSALGVDVDSVVRNGIDVVELTTSFAERAKAKVLEIIDEMFLPQNLRKNAFSNVTFSSSTKDAEVPIKIIFKEEFLTISLALPERVEKIFLKEKQLNESVVQENSVVDFYPAQRAAARVFGTGDHQRLHLRLGQTADVPHHGAALVHGGLQRWHHLTPGFHCFVEMNFNLSSNNQVYGRKDGDFHQIVQISDSLMKMGKYLRIRQHPIKGRIIGDLTNPDIFTSQNLLIYRFSRQAGGQTQADSVNEVADDQENNGKSDEIYFVKNAESILPIDIEIASNRSKIIKRQRLRPEFLSRYKKKLNPDTFQENQGNSQLDQNDFELTEANKELTSKCVNELVKGLDSMEFLPMDSPGLARVFHQFGVNLRYLG